MKEFNFRILNINENLFRLIFETKIHIQIHIRYFKSLPIATYYLTTIHIKNLYLHEKTYNPGKSVNPNINLIETMTNLIVAWKFSQKRTQESLFAPQTL